MNVKRLLIPTLLLSLALLFVFFLRHHRLFPLQHGDGSCFGITSVQSSMDYNNNGLDDYTDFLMGARQDAKTHPTYDPAYWDGGYPPEDIGVCTDVVWRAFRQAGYSLRGMVDQDIQNRPDAYPHVAVRDNNIDFRRVPNLHEFFRTHGVTLTTDITDIAQWQPGDIVIFGEDQHIGIVSDLRNSQGQPYIIHNGGQPDREENYLPDADVTGHYRFDASLVDEALLIPWDQDL